MIMTVYAKDQLGDVYVVLAVNAHGNCLAVIENRYLPFLPINVNFDGVHVFRIALLVVSSVNEDLVILNDVSGRRNA